MGGVAFAMKESGLPASACSWYGQKGGGIRFLNDHAMADLLKYADLIKIGNKTPAQLEAAGMLCPGDILTFATLAMDCPMTPVTLTALRRVRALISSNGLVRCPGRTTRSVISSV